MAVPTLYRTESGREFIAPGNKLGVTVEPGNERVGLGYVEVRQPALPRGPAKMGEAVSFHWPNFLAYAEDGTVGSS